MNYSIIREIENEQLKPEVTEFNVGDTVRVYAKVVEGTRERLQMRFRSGLFLQLILSDFGSFVN